MPITIESIPLGTQYPALYHFTYQIAGSNEHRILNDIRTSISLQEITGDLIRTRINDKIKIV